MTLDAIQKAQLKYNIKLILPTPAENREGEELLTA